MDLAQQIDTHAYESYIMLVTSSGASSAYYRLFIRDIKLSMLKQDISNSLVEVNAPKYQTIRLPVAVRGSTTSVLKLSNAREKTKRQKVNKYLGQTQAELEPIALSNEQR